MVHRFVSMWRNSSPVHFLLMHSSLSIMFIGWRVSLARKENRFYNGVCRDCCIKIVIPPESTCFLRSFPLHLRHTPHVVCVGGKQGCFVNAIFSSRSTSIGFAQMHMPRSNWESEPCASGWSGTMTAKDLRQKFATYAMYLASHEWARSSPC